MSGYILKIPKFILNFLTNIGKFVESEGELSNEERNIVSAAYKNVVGNKRAELRVLTAIEQKESAKNENIKLYIRNYKFKIEKELKTYCSTIVSILDKYLIPNAKSLDSKVNIPFFLFPLSYL